MLDAFMYLNGSGMKSNPAAKVLEPIRGESNDKDFPNSLELEKFEWGAKNSVESFADESGGTGGKPGKGSGPVSTGRGSSRHSSLEIETFDVKKEVDLATPSLFLALCHGCTFASAKVIFRKAGGKVNVPFLVLYFTDVKLEKWDLSSDEDKMMEDIKFSFKTCTIKYQQQKPDGSAGTSDIKSWNREKNNTQVDGVPRDL